ncbi:grpE protein homolog 2, mitochondrial [Tachysurus fulvidraco]|uniref:grpE protein homolog 2, mitochondrial n=1 Tax=Tachysurus fulvidraco TaxID=1234273 RepID=UPI000F4F6852|nr:grpE protein homolog 2, mitochondrial [Tachysurus fulvidraco]
MAVCFLSLCGKKTIHLATLPSKLCRVSTRIGFSSTAAERRTTGDDCHNDDGDDEQSLSVTHVRMLEMKANKLEEQVRDLTQRYKRALADSDNVRRRTQKFVEDAKTFGIQSFCRDLVEVADLLDKAAGGINVQDTQNMTEITNKLQQVFSKHGLEKMRPVGGAYDPYQHQIVCHMPAEGLEPGIIATVKLDGYTLHGRTIRHAHVGIAVKTQDS